MAKMDHVKAAETDRRLQEALAHGALPGEREGFDDEAAQEAVSFMREALSIRTPGEAVISMGRVPAAASLGKGAARALRIALVNDDMPFLVDSVANCLAAQGIVIRRLMHPVLGVEREGDGTLVRILPRVSPGARRESAIFIEIDHVSARQAERLEGELRLTLAHVRVAVIDWSRMQEALAADADRVSDDEGASLLRWLLDRNFTQTGHQFCRRDGSCEAALGICALGGAEPLLAPASIEAAFTWFEEGGRTPLVVKSNQSSRVHRSSLIDLFIIPVREGKTIRALSIHAGMWTSAALASPPDRVPILRSALNALMEKHHFDPSGHAGKALFHALTALPHDILIGFDRATLERLALTFMSLADRPRPRLVLAAAPLARHLYCFVWLPRDEVSTGRRVAIQDMLKNAANAPLLSWSIALEEGGLALLRITLDLRASGKIPDEVALDAQLRHMVRGWVPAVEVALAEGVDPARAATLAEKYADGFPQGYRLGAGPEEAALDIAELIQIEQADEKRVRFYRNEGDKSDQLRLKLYSRTAIALSDAVPAFENFGFKAIEEVTTPAGARQAGPYSPLPARAAR
jgi:glutamate dehydrogenase